MWNRLSSKSKMLLNHQNLQNLIRISSSRWYLTVRQNKASLYSKISPMGNPEVSIAGVINDWVQQGNKVRFSELDRIVHDLRKRRRFSQALEVSEWMSKEGNCTFSSVQHAVQIDLVGKVHGFVSAENYFNNLTNEEKTVKTYGALLHCYVRQRQIDKALVHLQKMKERGFSLSTLTYNDVMCLYTNVSQNEKVPNVLAEMKKNGVTTDNYSYRICINSYGVRSDIEGVESILKEMENQSHIVMDWNTYAVVANFYIKEGLNDKAKDVLKKAEEKLQNKDGLGYNHLISLHARLGNKAEVLRLWDLEKIACKRCMNRDYSNMLESLVKLGELEQAEKLLREWESSGNCFDFRLPNIVVTACSDKGLCEKAEAILEDLIKKGKATTPDSWAKIAAGYLDKGEMEKSVQCMKAAFSLHVEGEGWKPDPEVIRNILKLLGDKGTIEDVQTFVGLLRSVMPIDKQMYHAMIKAHIRGGKEVDGLLSNMKSDKIDEDPETRKILQLRK